jgi:hypothetical protein
MTTTLETFLAEVGKHVHPPKEKTLFSLGGRAYFENPASDLLAFFLKPDAEHGFKSLFLQAFIECIQFDPSFLVMAGVTVSREVETADGGRIDIEVIGPDWVLLIENKVYASQVNPFQSYEEHGRKLAAGKTLLLAVLSPGGECVPANWRPVSYKAYCAALRLRLGGELLDHPYSKWVVFAREFILHFENELYKAAMNEHQADFVERYAKQIEQAKALDSEYREFLLDLLKRSLDAGISGHAFTTSDDRWAIRCYADKWGRSNLAFWSELSGVGRKHHVSVYLVDLTTEQEAQAIRELQEARRMRQWREGKWLCWQTRPGFDTRKEAVLELCALGVVLAEIFKPPPEPVQPLEATGGS